jgi:hypothetical protein
MMAAAGHFVSIALPKAAPAPTRHSSIKPIVLGAGILLLLSVAALTAHALAPTPTTVFLVPGPKDAPDRESVLVPPDLLKQLDNLADRGPAGLRGAILLGARYEGRIDNLTAQFEAHFRVHNFAADEQLSPLTLPLGGVQLQEALLDGAAASPRTLPGARPGFLINVKGRGGHVVVLRFTVPVSELAEDRELRFAIPGLVQSQLVLDLPAGARYADTVGGVGAQSLKRDPLQLSADLGRAAALHVRWRPETGPAREVKVRVQESYYWDLRSASARLLGLLDYQISQGAVPALLIDLPRDTAVRSVDAEVVSAGTSVPRLKRWLLVEQGANRRMRLEFQRPVNGQVIVTLELVPRQPLGPHAVFHFPKPVGDEGSKGDAAYRIETTRSYLAYRLEGLQALGVKGSAITGLVEKKAATAFADALEKPWQAARREHLEPPTGAYLGTRGGTPILEMTLRAPDERGRWVQDVSWHVGPRQADLTATVRISDCGSSQSLVEWDVPPNVIVAAVSGPDVQYWSRREAGPRLQVWLKQPVRQTSLQLTGWLPGRALETRRFVLPCLRSPAFKNQITTVHLHGDSTALTPEKLQNLQRSDPRPGQETVYVAQQPYYAGTFRVGPATGSTHLRVLTFAEVHDRSLRFTADLDYRLQQGEFRGVTLSLRNWDGEVTVHAPLATHIRSKDEVRKTSDEDFLLRPTKAGSRSARTYVIELQPGLSGQYRLTLSGSVPLGKAAEILMPDVRVEAPGVRPAQVARWLALARPDLVAEAPSGLAPAAHPVEALTAWPREADRLRRAGGSAWKVASDDWRLRLRPSVAASETAPVRLVLTEMTAAVVDGRRWSHQATFWIFHEAGADLRIQLPAGAVEVLPPTVDGVDGAALQPEPEQFWLRLPPQAGVRRIRLTWMFPPEKERLAWPNLRPASVDGVGDLSGTRSSILWTVHIPPGYRAQDQFRPDGDTPFNPAAAPAGQDLRRAAACLQLLDVLGQRARDAGDDSLASQMPAMRDGCERFCRQAEHWLAVPETNGKDTGPAGQGLANWLQELRDQCAQLAQKYDLDKHPSAVAGLPYDLGSSGASSALPVEEGTPAYWQGSWGIPAPSLRLVAIQPRETMQTWVLTILLLGLLATIWGLARVPRGVVWPEQLALLGLVGLLAFGPGWGSVFWLLPAVWLGVRAVWLIRWALSHWPQAATETAPANPV